MSEPCRSQSLMPEPFKAPVAALSARVSHDNNFNLIRLVAAVQVLLVHGLNHLDFEGPLVSFLKAVPGVPTFFFISGWLVGASYLRMQSRGVAPFFVNRALRIFPGLWWCVLASAVMVWLTGYPGLREAGSSHVVAWVAGQASFVQFYNPDFMRQFGVGVLNGALWTITVELQFYLLTPWLCLLAARRPHWFATLFVASLLVNLMVVRFGSGDTLFLKLVYVSALPWVFMFMSGLLMAQREDLLHRLRPWLRLRWLLPAYALSMLAIGRYEVNAANSINAVSFLLLAATVVRLSDAPVPLPQRWTRFVRRNDFSYGVYLAHMPLLNLMIYLQVQPASHALAVLIAATLATAVLSWYLVERPALRRKR